MKTNNSNSSLSTKALLVTVNISQWTGRKIDRAATDLVQDQKGAERNSGNYHKKLLPAATELEAIAAIASQARKFFYDNSLPWLSDGTRIISSENYIDFSKDFKKIRQKFDSAVKAFEVAYPSLQTQAQQKLGQLYSAEEYPSATEIGQRFKIDLGYYPLPDATDFRIDISEQDKKEFEAKILDVQAKGLNECFNRLHDVVQKAVDRLGQPDATFRDSLIENINEVVKILPRLNINNNVELETSRKEIASIVSNLSGPSLRQNATAKQDAHAKLKKALANMGAIMGSASN